MAAHLNNGIHYFDCEKPAKATDGVLEPLTTSDAVGFKVGRCSSVTLTRIHDLFGE